MSWQYKNSIGRHLFFVVVIISVGSNTVAAYTGNNYACLRHKRFTDNDRNQKKVPSFLIQIFGNWPEKLIIVFVWP
jgi:hypothetical protein